MKFLSKLTAIGLAFSLAAGLAGCQSAMRKPHPPPQIPLLQQLPAKAFRIWKSQSRWMTSHSRKPRQRLPNPRTLPKGTGRPGEGTTAANGEVDLSKVVALTFDDGPDTKDTSSSNRILDVLEQYGCKATFFVQGQAAQDWLPERNKATVKREADLGMEIGTHHLFTMLICASSRRMK